ncbi:diaminobutyrate acetyltransferase [Streptomyces meridianus]|uniref:L-2,4-diaminobutyric acid acetyltransferase n=1 Tax=Streptomyces meridianus TaxID=2938945 RepID=A0ABT0X4S5_9ACTN|nr:diaminobutyrate acetyltransferase [Streptomyces meridianus]MCM2577542.1 diaminobutyrate acetyltransferase [Streptomyces meridianus]
MTAAQADVARAHEFHEMPEGLKLDAPRLEDGSALWRIARDSRVLDLNSSYSYLLWCRDFAATSVVARDADGDPVGFITGYLRPDQPQTLFVWQVAVDEAQRGRGLAGALLDGLAARVCAAHGVRALETTITDDNAASIRLFTSFAQRHHASVNRDVLFDSFPDEGHDPEVLYRIGPIDVSPAPR